MAHPEASTLTDQNSSSSSESMANLVNSSATTTATTSSLTAAQILAIAIVIIGSVGMTANALVAYVVLASKHFKKTKGVNLLIVNQLIHDMYTCMTLVAVISTVLLPTTTIYRLMRSCVYVYLQAAFWAGLNGSVLNLACVTVERYLMVVHTLWHRKWFSSWMVFVAGALSWIVSWTSALAASMATASVDAAGFCLPNIWWPSRPAKLVYAAWNFVSYFVIEAVIFVYCYVHIMVIIRRQARIKSAAPAAAAAASATAARDSDGQRTVNNPDDGSPTATCATAFKRTSMFTVVPATVAMVVVGSSGGGGVSPAAAAAAAAATVNSSSSTTKPFLTQMHLSALKTSIIVTTVFFISWTPYQMYTLLSSVNDSAVYQTGLTLTLLIVLLNVCVNPFIYAGKYDLIKHRFAQYCTKSKAACKQCGGGSAFK